MGQGSSSPAAPPPMQANSGYPKNQARSLNQSVQKKNETVESNNRSVQSKNQNAQARNQQIQADQAFYKTVREESTVYRQERDRDFQKARENFDKGNHQLAKYYAEKGRADEEKYKAANSKAVNKIVQHNGAHKPKNSIDTHGLTVHEALDVTKKAIQKNDKRGQPTHIITGQGKHSQNGPKIKPAVVKNLQEQGRSVTVHKGAVTVKNRKSK